jgi:cytochrome c biogenesis protein CcmG/thiol:disulfide interchange protein DsbE
MATEYEDVAPVEEAETAEKAGRRLPRGVEQVIITLVIGVVIAAVGWYFIQPGSNDSVQSIKLTADAAGPAPDVGKPAPDFKLTDLSGNPIQLSDYRGKVVWVTFWASWCPPCRAELPDIDATYQKYRDAGLVVVAVDIGEPTADARGYVERTGLSFPVGLDQTTAVAAAYRINGIPTHYFVDANGVLQDFRIGALSLKAMDAKIAALLGGEGK